MGYTHYWGNTKFTTEQWEALTRDAALIFKKCTIPIAAEMDKPKHPPHIGLECIVFNGIGDDGHETFMLHKDPDPNDFIFCKTARKDYDAVVVAILLLATVHNPDFNWTSDGDNDPVANFSEGRELLCASVTGTNGLTRHPESV